jgi:hypothetical protein
MPLPNAQQPLKADHCRCYLQMDYQLEHCLMILVEQQAREPSLQLQVLVAGVVEVGVVEVGAAMDQQREFELLHLLLV